MKNGNLPFWNPYIFSGTPLLANWQAAVLYPLNILFFLFPELDAWAIYLAFQPLLASLIMYWFLENKIKEKIPSLLGAVSWGFSLVMLNHLEFGIDGHTVLWLPLGLLAIDKINQKVEFKWGLVLSMAVLMSFLAGYFPLAVYNFLLVGLYAFYFIKPTFSLRFWLVCLFMILGVGLAAPQFLPGLKLSQKVVREEVFYGESSDETYFLPLENLIMVFAPDFFGHPSTWNFYSKIYYADNASVGSVAFVFYSLTLLFIFSKKVGEERRKDLLFWWLVVWLPTFLMVNNPVSELLRKIPINFLARVSPMRMIWVVAFGLSTLSALGFSQVINFFRKRQFKKLRLLIFPLILVFFFWFLSFVVPAGGQEALIAQRNLILPTLVSLTTIFSLGGAYFFKRLRGLIFIFLIFLARRQ